MSRAWTILLMALTGAGLIAGGWWWRTERNANPTPDRARTGVVQGALIADPLARSGAMATNPAPVATAVAPQAAEAPAMNLVAPSAVPSPAPALLAPLGPVEEGPLAVTFDRLASFEYVMPAEPMTNSPALTPGGSEQIPQEIRAYDQQVLGVKGFMLPIKVQNGLVTEMLLMRDQSMCCYGVTPKITEWVNVKVTGKGVKPIMDQPVTMFGRFQVGEVRENGYLVCLYRMDADRMTTALDE